MRTQPRAVVLAVSAALMPWVWIQPAGADPAPNQLPTGGQVTSGTANISTTGSKMQIDQATNKAILNWQTFSIGSSAWVNFSQPSASSVALNKVLGNNPSEIFGRLTANGQVFLSNPSGVLFARGASVEVGSLFATSLTISDQDFNAGRYNWSNPGNSGSVVNQGTIITTNGYAALAGPQVRNDGIIIAQAGTVTLAAGDRVTLDMVGDGLISVSVDQAALNASAINAGTIQADGGRVLLTARSANALLDTVINNTGVIRARSLIARNGEIVLDAGGNGSIAVAGEMQGGEVSISGGNLAVNNRITSTGAMTVSMAGDVAVTTNVTQDAALTSFGGQTINARSLSVTSSDPRIAEIVNNGPNGQSINLTGGAGLDVRTLSPGGFAQIRADGGGSQTINVLNADHINVDGARGGAWIVNFGGPQTLSITGSGANAISLGSAGNLGFSQIRGSTQNIVAGAGGESGSISITGADANATFTGFSSGQTVGGTQSVSTSGTLRITGGNAPNQPPAGFATGLFHNGSGEQRVSAANIEMQGGANGVNNAVIIIASPLAGTTAPGNQVIEASGGIALRAGSGTSNGAGIFQNRTGLQGISAANLLLEGGSAGSGNGVFINATFGGDQLFTVPGEIRLAGGAGGTANRAGIVTNGSQTINGNPDVLLMGGGGGAAGVGNSVFINATGGDSRPQTINARSLTLAAGPGIDAAATMTASRQVIATTGDVSLLGSDGLGALQGARIGGLAGAAPTPTNLVLNVGGDLLLRGGGGPSNGVAIGSAATSTQSNTITITALSGDVTLESGAGAGARIGSSALAPGVAPGNISITAGGDIRLNGVSQSTAIRTLDTVALNAANIREASNGFIVAGTLNTFTTGDTALTGPNQISRFNGSTYGDLTLNNNGALDVSGFYARNAALTNNGDVTISYLWSSSGATSITTVGPDSDVNVLNSVQSFGPMTLNVDGALRVTAVSPWSASLTSFGGQNITARSVEVSARDGQFARIGNNAGDQTITAYGGNIDVQTLPGSGFSVAQIFTNPGVNQTIRVIDGDHLNINGAGSGVAGVFSNGVQTLSITGGGANAITVGSLGARGASNVGGAFQQDITAGLAGEQGSITIVGSDAQGSLAGFVTNPFAGGTQAVSTSGTISVTGGRAAPQLGNFPAGIFHNGTGQQTINAARIELQGGPSGSNNAALINVPGGGVPANAGAQLINVSGDIDIAGGPGGNAGILGSGVRQQTIYADNISLTNSAAGGINSVGFIQGGHQEIHAAGDVTLTARASGGDLAGVRIGGNATNPTDLRLFVGGDLILTGGSAANNGVGIGSTATVGGLANQIYVEAGGSVILNAGTLSNTGSRIGSPAAGTGPGNIEIRAGGGVELNGAVQGTAIRTLGNVTLNAASISEASNGFIVASGLNTTSSGNTSLIGPNQVSSFIGSSGTGDVSLANTSALLTVSSLVARDVVLNQAGDLAVTGNVVASGAGTINATGGITLAADTTPIEVRAGGPVSMIVGNDLRLAGGAGADAHALVFSGSNIFLTVGGIVTLNAGSGENSWARIQTATRDSVINIYFPNLSSGGYFVNDVEGALRRGQTGFLSGNGVAAPGQEFVTTYGLE